MVSFFSICSSLFLLVSWTERTSNCFKLQGSWWSLFLFNFLSFQTTFCAETTWNECTKNNTFFYKWHNRSCKFLQRLYIQFVFGRMCGLNSFIILFYFFPQFLGRIQEVLKPLNRILGVSLELVLIIHKEETKPWSKSSSPLPII